MKSTRNKAVHACQRCRRQKLKVGRKLLMSVMQLLKGLSAMCRSRVPCACEVVYSALYWSRTIGYRVIKVEDRIGGVDMTARPLRCPILRDRYLHRCCQSSHLWPKPTVNHQPRRTTSQLGQACQVDSKLPERGILALP